MVRLRFDVTGYVIQQIKERIDFQITQESYYIIAVIALLFLLRLFARVRKRKRLNSMEVVPCNMKWISYEDII